MTGRILPELKPSETVLLIIDMQNDFCKRAGYFGKVKSIDPRAVEEIIPNLALLLEFARKKDLLRVFVKTIHSGFTDSENWKKRYKLQNELAILPNQAKDGIASSTPQLCAPNTWGSEIIDELRPRDDESVVVKHRYSAFMDSNLQLILRSKAIGNTLITGNATNVCVESTARHSFMLDYVTVTISDCVGTTDEAAHSSSLWNLENYFGHVATSKQVIEMIEASR